MWHAHNNGWCTARKLSPLITKENLLQCTMCTPNTRNRIMYTRKQNTIGRRNRFHLAHDDTHRFPPSTGITIPIGSKSPTGKQYMCTSGQQFERGTWRTQPQEYKTISLSHVVSNDKKYWLLVTVTPWVQKQFHLHMSYVTTRNTDPSINNNQPISTVWKRRSQTTLFQ